jgi:hypothetical protein
MKPLGPFLIASAITFYGVTQLQALGLSSKFDLDSGRFWKGTEHAEVINHSKGRMERMWAWPEVSRG